MSVKIYDESFIAKVDEQKKLGKSTKDIAKSFGISFKNLSRICNRYKYSLKKYAGLSKEEAIHILTWLRTGRPLSKYCSQNGYNYKSLVVKLNTRGLKCRISNDEILNQWLNYIDNLD